MEYNGFSNRTLLHLWKTKDGDQTIALEIVCKRIMKRFNVNLQIRIGFELVITFTPIVVGFDLSRSGRPRISDVKVAEVFRKLTISH